MKGNKPKNNGCRKVDDVVKGANLIHVGYCCIGTSLFGYCFHTKFIP